MNNAERARRQEIAQQFEGKLFNMWLMNDRRDLILKKQITWQNIFQTTSLAT